MCQDNSQDHDGHVYDDSHNHHLHNEHLTPDHLMVQQGREHTFGQKDRSRGDLFC